VAVAAAAAIVAVGLVKTVGIITRRIAATMVHAGVQAILRERLAERYHRLPLTWHHEHPAGELLSRAEGDLDAASEILSPLPFATGVLTMLGAAAVWLFLADPFLAALGLLVVPAILGLNLVFQRRVERPTTLGQERLGGCVGGGPRELRRRPGGQGPPGRGGRGPPLRRQGRAAARRPHRGGQGHGQLRGRPGRPARPDHRGAAGDRRLADRAGGDHRRHPGRPHQPVLPADLAAAADRVRARDMPRAVAGYERVAEVLAEPLPSPPVGGRELPGGPLELVVDRVGYG
jgi:ABC transporter transmembrane region